MQIITGKYKGRKLISIDSQTTRPTLARVKESIFAMIQGEINGSVVLDLFAGSGAMGIESISEGAEKVYFVDKNPEYKKILNKNLVRVNEPYEILTCDYLDALNIFNRKNLQFNLVFLDPPYDSDFGEKALSLLRDLNLLKKDAIIVFEQISKKCLQNPPKGYIISKYKTYGLASVTILKYTGEQYGHNSIN